MTLQRLAGFSLALLLPLFNLLQVHAQDQHRLITGKVINQDNRAFQVEIHIPNGSDIRANQVAIVKLQDYSATNVISIPINTLQTDETGKYVLVGVQQQDRLVAHKKSITIGQTYGDKVQVTGGLESGDRLITDGYQGLYEGQLITIQ